MKARLDADRTATGKTHHPSVGDRIGSGVGPLVNPEYEAEDGTRMPLTGPALETPKDMAERLVADGVEHPDETCGVMTAAIRARDEQIATWCEAEAEEAWKSRAFAPDFATRDQHMSEWRTYRAIAAALRGAGDGVQGARRDAARCQVTRRRKCDLCGERVTEPGRLTLDIVSPGGTKGRLPYVRYKATICSVVCLVAIVRSAATDYRKGTKRGSK